MDVNVLGGWCSTEPPGALAYHWGSSGDATWDVGAGLFREASLGAQMVRNPTANAGDIIDVSLIPGLGRSPGGGLGNPLQYSCLENPMNRGAVGILSMGLLRVGHD